ncbi:MAG: hypothetical protein Tsb0033_14800 [Winogradskyella sp.]
MAHENLKFRLSTTSTNWQPVYGGQHHGTFYMVYIKIKSYDKIEIAKDKTAYELVCDFRLQNFRGAITMGLVDFSGHNFAEETHDDTAEHILYFNLEVAPFTKNDYLNNIKILLEAPIEKGLISVFKVLLLLPPKNIFNPNDLENSLYLNPYTHVRDGDQYIDVAYRKHGTKDPFEAPEGMGWGKYGLCVPDVCIFD